jgi:hypothetical protein
MKRSEVAKTLNTVREAIEETGVLSTLAELARLRPEQAKDTSPIQLKILAAMTKFFSRAESFSESDRTTISILGLEGLLSHEFWSGLMDSDRSRAHASQSYTRVRFIVETLPRLAQLFGANDVTEIQSEKQTRASPWRDYEFISVTAIEAGKSLSTPARLANILESLDLLYRAVAEIENLPQSDLVVAGCDSGSDKSFDFLGLAQVVAGVKEILIAAWDRVVFYRERKFDSQLDLIIKTLPILERIDQMRDANSLSPESAELLRRRISEGVSKFIDAGATIPELEKHAAHSPRALMAPQPKYLAAPANPSAPSVETEKFDEDLPPTKGEIEEFRRRLERFSKKDKPD